MSSYDGDGCPSAPYCRHQLRPTPRAAIWLPEVFRRDSFLDPRRFSFFSSSLSPLSVYHPICGFPLRLYRAIRAIAKPRRAIRDGNSPDAVDHVPFYGPVFFELASMSFRLFGVSERSLRLVSFLGMIMLASAGTWLARGLNAKAIGGPGRSSSYY